MIGARSKKQHISAIYRFKPTVRRALRVSIHEPVLSLNAIHRTVKQMTDFRISKKASKILQVAADDVMRVYFECLDAMAYKSGRVTVTKMDMKSLKEFAGCIEVPKTDEMAIPKTAFMRIARDIIRDNKGGMRTSKGFKLELQSVAEQFVSTHFKKMAIITRHAKRVTVKKHDSSLTQELETRLRGEYIVR